MVVGGEGDEVGCEVSVEEEEGETKIKLRVGGLGGGA